MIVVPASARGKTCWVVVTTFIAYLLFVGVKLEVYHLDISRFIVAGDRFFSPHDLTYPVYVQPHSDGYDGQFFYRLALNPFTTKQVAYGITMEAHPVVRAQRILYPVVAWAISLGRGAFVPYALVLINLLSVVTIGWTARRLAAHFTIPARLSLLVPFYPGFVFSISHDTAEVFSAALAFSALLAATKRRYALAAALASLAVLARETTLLYLIGVGLVALSTCIREHKPNRIMVCCLLPLIVFIVWQAVLKAVWGNLPFGDIGHHDLAVPFVGYAAAIVRDGAAVLNGGFHPKALFDLFLCAAAGLFAVFILVSQWRPAHPSPKIFIAWVAYAALASLFTDAIWDEPLGFLRILCDFYILGVATLIASADETALRKLAPFVAVTWIASFVYAL